MDTTLAAEGAQPAMPPTYCHKTGHWAPPVSRLRSPALPPGATNLNVDGRRLVGPLHGFGQLRRKTYSIRLSGATVSPAEVVGVWKQNFARFWPKGNTFYGAQPTIQAGDVALMELSLLGGMRLCTGVLVIYADDTSFCFMTPEGHMFGGFITFSACDDNGTTVVQVQPLIRANDPLYELTMRLGLGHRIEDQFWRQALKNLAAHFGVQANVEQQTVLIDRGVQWSKAGNIWYNAAIRTMLYVLATPLRRLQRLAVR